MQKMGHKWLGWKEEKNQIFIRHFVVWLGGFLLYNLSVLPIGIASKALPPYIISSISAFGICLILIFSYFLLNEELYISDIYHSILMVSSIFIVCYFQRPIMLIDIHIPALYILLLLPFLLIIVSYIKRDSIKIKTVLFSLLSGCTGGLTLVLINIAVKQNDNHFLAYFSSPYFYLWLGMGALSLIALQFAIKYGDIILVGPLQQSSNIIYPVICSYFIFGASLILAQIIAVLVIIYACFAMLRKRNLY
jgi:uncharacterized membrane protein